MNNRRQQITNVRKKAQSHALDRRRFWLFFALVAFLIWALAISSASPQSAQPQGARTQRARVLNFAPWNNASAIHPSAVSIARLHYTGGGDWYWGTSALPNLLTFIRDETGWMVDTIESKTMVSDPELFDHPFLFATGHGTMRFSESDRDRLRSYLNAGGFLFINDSYGMAASVRSELANLFPDRELVELPFSHDIYHSYYDFPNGPPKIHEHDNAPPQGYAIMIGDRVAVYFLVESDIGDGWEDSQTHNDPPEKRRQALQMGVNLLAYALTH